MKVVRYEYWRSEKLDERGEILKSGQYTLFYKGGLFSCPQIIIGLIQTSGEYYMLSEEIKYTK